MEGITGVVQPAQLGPTGFEYSRAREWMTGEVKAAINGARAAGATSFVVADSHGNAQSLLIDQLPDEIAIAHQLRRFPYHRVREAGRIVVGQGDAHRASCAVVAAGGVPRIDVPRASRVDRVSSMSW